MTGTFIDTMVICTMTGLAILITGANTSGLEGAAVTSLAFNRGLIIPFIGEYIVNIGLIFFAFTTIIGWNYYGERCMYYLAGIRSIKIYKDHLHYSYCDWSIYVITVYLYSCRYRQWSVWQFLTSSV